MEKGVIGLNLIHRQFLNKSLSETVSVKWFKVEEYKNIYLSHLQLSVDVIQKAKYQKFAIKSRMLEKSIIEQFSDHIFAKKQKFACEFEGVTLVAEVINTNSVDIENLQQQSENRQEGKIIQIILYYYFLKRFLNRRWHEWGKGNGNKANQNLLFRFSWFKCTIQRRANSDAEGRPCSISRSI